LSVPDRSGRGGELEASEASEGGVPAVAGLLETLRVYEGRPFLWERHLQRLTASAIELDFPPPRPDALRAALDDLLAEKGLSDAVVRITLTRGGNQGPRGSGIRIEAEPLATRLWRGSLRGDPRAIVSRTPLEPGALGRHKTTGRLAYHLAREEARAAGADEALLVSPAGRVLEGAVSNVFARIGGELLTPPLAAGILPGVTRGFVLEACRDRGIRAREAPLRPADLEQAQEVFLTNSVQQVVPLARVDDHPVPERGLGERLLAIYRRVCGSRMASSAHSR
jgi:branched-chain amino acid aminotransferase